MSIKKRFLSLYAVAVSMLVVVAGCDKKGSEPDPVPDNAPTSITLGQSSVSAMAAGGTVSIAISSPVRPSLKSDASWVTVTDGTYSDYKITVTLNIAENTSYESRTAAVTVTAGSLSSIISVTQAAEEKTPDPDPDPDPDPAPEVNISSVPVNAGATSQAKALYQYIYGLYGKKTISSIMADVNWNNKEAEKVHDATGKYPAMNCYDFIHIYVPENNWINYSDLTPVTSWAAAGGLVSLMWHFNVPLSQTTIPGADGSGVTCDPSKTTFKASNALVGGTWEHDWFYGQMDKVADVILALQEKGIAAVWRPFHEAAGNAKYKQKANWTTSWFWWGYDGAEVYRKLWIAMYEYFSSKGISNLIWVWTTQNYNGDSSKYDQDTDWYPGKEYVDIVARDLYGSTASDNAAEFKQIQAAYPDKMVALGECGKSGSDAFATISSVWAAGAQWSWFMPWYGSNMPDTAWWTDALGSAEVVTRNDVPSDLFK